MPVILGIDEVGRGPWAGPLVVGAVILGETFAEEVTTETPNNIQTNEQNGKRSRKVYLDEESLSNLDLAAQHHYLWSHLADSKALTARQRANLSPLISQFAAASATGWVSSAELDQYGMSASLKLATRRAVKQILATHVAFDEIIIDGTVNYLINTPLADRVTILKKADALIKEVSAAAILAKVARDDYMTQLSQQYPEYGFEKHVGYGTKAHLEALEKYGTCPEHRMSFRPIQKILARHPQSNQGAALQHDISSERSISGQNTAEFNESPTYSGAIADRVASTTTRGQQAELVVAHYLEQRGHRIIAHNFKTKTCEIDLISTIGERIYFTEVKYSSNPTTEGTPLVRITPQKQRKMAYAAQVFLKTHDFSQFSPILAATSVAGEDYTVREWIEL